MLFFFELLIVAAIDCCHTLRRPRRLGERRQRIGLQETRIDHMLVDTCAVECGAFISYHRIAHPTPTAVSVVSVLVDLYFIQVLVLALSGLPKVHEIPVFLHTEHFDELPVLCRGPRLKLVVLTGVLFQAAPSGALESESCRREVVV